MKAYKLASLVLYMKCLGAHLFSYMARPCSHCQMNVETGLPLCSPILGSDSVRYDSLTKLCKKTVKLELVGSLPCGLEGCKLVLF